MSVFFVFLTQISDRLQSTALRGSAGRFPAIFGVGDAGKLKCRVAAVQIRPVHPAKADFFAFLTQISDQHPLAAPGGAAGRFPGIFGVGDAGNLKFQVNPVQTGLVHPANVDF